MDEEIRKIGIKAYSLKVLKERNIFEENLYISSDLSSKEKFVEAMEGEGFKDGDELSCRFSNPSRTVHFPRKTCSSFDEAYAFFKTSFKRGDTIIVHNLMHAKYDGTITFADDEIVMEFIEGDWNAGYSLNADTAVFKDGVSIWYLYQKVRKVPYVDGATVKFKDIGPISEETAEKITKNIAAKLPFLKDLLSGDFNSLATLIDDDGRLQPLKLHNILPDSIKPSQIAEKDVFELKTPLDLRRWDKKIKLLISIPANIDRADVLMGVISEIKKYTDNVYISYGILSHPAILLREAGFKVERKISNYKVLKFKY
jgi:hypothetical protein